uniref:DDE Tnp4 domain-containing protein n=1 Tax=Pundamilia nyererei TaxID=303518 RepID=A0A3B4GXP0_9CICH
MVRTCKKLQREGSHVSDITKQRLDIEFSAIPSFLLVCSRHFLSGKPAYEMDVTNPDWAPTLHMGHDDIPVSDSDRHRRRMQWKQKRAPIGGTPPQKNISCVGQVEVEVPAANVDSGDRTDSVTEAKGQTKDCVCNEQGRAEINRLLENRLLRTQLQKTELNKHFLKDDTEKVRYYTGLHCYAVLMSLFNTVKDFLPISKKLTGFLMLLITLMRLRLDLPVQHLCHLFDVSHKTLSSVFTDTIDVLYARLGALVHWPERHLAIIVDCFEIRTERPSNLKARAQTYSHYKGTHTINTSSGLHPMELFLSFPGDGGGASDKSQRNVAFFKSCYLRIHVERVIGSLRNKFKMLHITMPIRLLVSCEGKDTTLLDKIVKVCCVLVNMCPSVVVKPGPNETCSC